MLNHKKLHLYHAMASFMPDGWRFQRVRTIMLRWCGAEIGDGVYFSSTVRFEGGGRLIIGDGTWIGPQTLISCTGCSSKRDCCVRIGKNCMIAHMVSIKTKTHMIDPNGLCVGGTVRSDDISIGDGAWVCAGAIIIPGVSIGQKNVIAAGAVVTRSTPDFALMAGVPAVFKRDVREEKKIKIAHGRPVCGSGEII